MGNVTIDPEVLQGPYNTEKLEDGSVAILFEKLTKTLIEDATKAGLHNLTADQIRVIKECAQGFIA